MSVRRHQLSPSDNEVKITLPPLLHVTGAATDAETGRPIETFTVIPGIVWQADPSTRSPTWERRNAEIHQGGRFELEFDHPYPYRTIRIEAEGYAPAKSETFPGDQGGKHG